jgi:hypothetical protein
MVFQGFDSDEEDEDSGDENINETKCLEQEPQQEESKSQENFPNSLTNTLIWRKSKKEKTKKG